MSKLNKNKKTNLVALPFSTAILNHKASTIDVLFQDLLPKHILTLIWIIGRFQLFQNTHFNKSDQTFFITQDAFIKFRDRYRRSSEMVDMMNALRSHPYIDTIQWGKNDTINIEISERFHEEMAKSRKHYYVNLEFLSTKEVLKSRDMMFYAILIDFNKTIDRGDIIELSNKIKKESDKAVSKRQRCNRIQKIKAAFQTLAALGYLEQFAYHVVRKFKLTFKSLTKTFEYKPFSRKKEPWEDVDFDEIFKERGIAI